MKKIGFLLHKLEIKNVKTTSAVERLGLSYQEMPHSPSWADFYFLRHSFLNMVVSSMRQKIKKLTKYNYVYSKLIHT